MADQISKVEMIDNREIVVGEHRFPVHYYDPPIDGIVYSLEATSDSNDRYQPILYVRQLSGVTAKMLPNALGISIYNPKSSASFVNSLVINKLRNNCLMKIFLTLYYSKWDYELNLVHWSEVFRKNIVSSVPDIIGVSKDRDEYGVNLACEVKLAEDGDIFEAFNKITDAIEKSYLESIKAAETSMLNAAQKKPLDVRNEFKWWIRYVIVPLLGSGAFAAAIAWLIAKS